MAPLITLLLSTIAARSIGWLGWFDTAYGNNWNRGIAVGLPGVFVLTGISHFAPPLRGGLIAIVPPRLPAPGLLVTIAGVLELLGAAGLLYPPTQIAAASCLFVLMLVMF